MKKLIALGFFGVLGLSAILVVSLFFVGGTTLAKKPAPPAACAKAKPYGETTAAAAGNCRCPLIYAPVVCDGGKTYSNQCVADCHHAKNCVPSGGI